MFKVFEVRRPTADVVSFAAGNSGFNLSVPDAKDFAVDLLVVAGIDRKKLDEFLRSLEEVKNA